MEELELNLAGIPANRRDVFREFVTLVARMADENLIGFCAFGTWLAEDPWYADVPARSVMVLDDPDLNLLDKLAPHGRTFGKQNLAAPLTMTPAYIDASRDVFPLEFLEIRQNHEVIFGADHFADLSLKPADLRLQCERELKSTLIQMRQGLIAAAGDRQQLHALCVDAGERCVRVIRGVLHLRARSIPRTARELFEAAAADFDLRLVTLARAVSRADRLGFQEFRRCYAEVTALTKTVDELET